MPELNVPRRQSKGKLWKEKALRFIQLIAMGGFWSAVDI